MSSVALSLIRYAHCENLQSLISHICTVTHLAFVSQFAMAGLVKAKKYDWKDSNLSLFGSDLERNVSC